jgi:hypothetical protein
MPEFRRQIAELLGRAEGSVRVTSLEEHDAARAAFRALRARVSGEAILRASMYATIETVDRAALEDCAARIGQTLPGHQLVAVS